MTKNINNDQQLDPNNIKKILIIQWSAMGDCVIASGTFDDIRNHFPNAKIHLNTLPPWDKLFEYDDRIDKIINFPMRRVGILVNFKWLKLLKEERYDLIIDFQHNDRTKTLLTLSKLLGFKSGLYIGRQPFFCYDRTPPKNIDNIHVFERFKIMLSKTGIDTKSCAPKLIPSQKSIDDVQSRKNELIHQKKYVVFFPGCSLQGENKRWPERYFIQFAEYLFNEGVDYIVLIGAKDEEAICNNIAKTDHRFINLCNQTALLEIPLWCEGASLIIGNDTGASHIAASIDVPQIALFGPTDAVKSKPYGYKVRALSAKDTPSKIIEPETAMENLTPEHVWAEYRSHFKV